MGLFSSGGADGCNAILGFGLSQFNDICGAVYSVKASLNDENLKTASAAFERICTLGFPENPGPFKRLGAFAILSQIWPFFTVTHVIEGRTESPEELEIIWQPRIIVWILPIFAAALEISGQEPSISQLVLPTPHFQVEFIAYLGI